MWWEQHRRRKGTHRNEEGIVWDMMRMDRGVTNKNIGRRYFLTLLASQGVRNDEMGDAKNVNKGRGVVQ